MRAPRWSPKRCRSLIAIGLLALTAAACDGDDGDGSAASSTTATAPAGEASGPLQFRPVLSSEGEGCSSPAENPPGDQPVSLTGRDGTCYELGPAFLTVRRAEAAVDSEPDEPPVVTVQLEGPDTVAFTRFVSDQLDRPVAVVMFGRVQTAPVIRDVPAGGLIAISGLDAQTAADVVDSLSN